MIMMIKWVSVLFVALLLCCLVPPIKAVIQDDIFCGIIEATNIASATSASEWSCTNGVPVSPACSWNFVICDSSANVTSLSISGIGLQGDLIY
jgi:hypothetical protein